MLKGLLVAFGLGATSVAFGVLLQNLHLKPRTFSGTVRSRDGSPVANASIHHTGNRRSVDRTHEYGRFAFVTDAPAVVVRKAGFQSVFLRLPEAGAELAVIAEQDSGRMFPVCVQGKPWGLADFMAEFRFPRIRGVKATKQSNDVDYGARSYFVTTSSGRYGIQHGGGPMWGGMIPLDDYVWKSTAYQETTYLVDDRTVIDARGVLTDGRHWRQLGHSGESARYEVADESVARTLDRVLDGACLKPAVARSH